MKIKIAAAVLAASSACALADSVFEIRQGGDVLGYGQTFSTSRTLADFYSYDDFQFEGEAGVFEVADIANLGQDALTVLVVNASDGVGFIMLGGDGTFNDGDDASGFESYADATVSYTRAFSANDLVVRDDNNESSVVGGSVHFDGRWYDHKTDGFAVFLPGGAGVGDTITISRNVDGRNTINSTNVFGFGNPLVQNTGANFNDGDFELTIVPLPSVSAMAGLGLLAMGTRRQRNRA